jgi:flagellum-specific ATP synthase
MSSVESETPIELKCAPGDDLPFRSRLSRAAEVMRAHRLGLPVLRRGGTVGEVTATHIRVSGLSNSVQLGSLVEIDAEDGGPATLGEVISIQQHMVTAKLFNPAPRLGLGTRTWAREALTIRPDRDWLGRVINALGSPIDGKGPLGQGRTSYAIDCEPLPPMSLRRISRPCPTGVKAIDLFTPLCAGQRIGVFAGSGVGKSTLISMLTRSARFSTIVVALVAERAREVREFIEDVIVPTGARAVTVVATSSESAIMRRLAAQTAMTVAEYLRDGGDDVLLVVDSVTRYAHALREIALAAGEPPVARGYAPSVFADLPRLLERAGPGQPTTGSITGVFSVLVDGDDHNDPVADTVRGILDGHIVLDRKIADQGRFPAIDPLRSISRLAGHVWSKDEALLVRRLRALVSRFEETRELRTLGAYKPGADLELDQAVLITPALYQLLSQMPSDPPSHDVFADLRSTLERIAAEHSDRRPAGAGASAPPAPTGPQLQT